MSLKTKTPGAGKQPGATIESGRRKFTASDVFVAYNPSVVEVRICRVEVPA